MFRFNPEQLGERLHALRRRRGQTLRELGTQADVSYVTLSKIERGKMPQVSADIVARVAVALGVSTDELLGIRDAADTMAREEAHETTPPTTRAWKDLSEADKHQFLSAALSKLSPAARAALVGVSEADTTPPPQPTKRQRTRKTAPVG